MPKYWGGNYFAHGSFPKVVFFLILILYSLLQPFKIYNATNYSLAQSIACYFLEFIEN